MHEPIEITNMVIAAFEAFRRALPATTQEGYTWNSLPQKVRVGFATAAAGIRMDRPGAPEEYPRKAHTIFETYMSQFRHKMPFETLMPEIVRAWTAFAKTAIDYDRAYLN